MKPKDKAKELYDKFDLKAEEPIWMMSANHVKQCAINCADELIQAFTQLSIEESGTIHIDFGHGYWEEVKREIEEL